MNADRGVSFRKASESEVQFLCPCGVVLGAVILDRWRMSHLRMGVAIVQGNAVIICSECGSIRHFVSSHHPVNVAPRAMR